MASVSSTVADLHDLGIVHGRLGPSHILIGPNGRPIIPGFGPSDRAPGDSRLTPLDDVAAIGEIIIATLGPQPGGEPIPARRWPWRPTLSVGMRAHWLTLADKASPAQPP